jgi:hypothetical protein
VAFKWSLSLGIQFPPLSQTLTGGFPVVVVSAQSLQIPAAVVITATAVVYIGRTRSAAFPLASVIRLAKHQASDRFPIGW